MVNDCFQIGFPSLGSFFLLMDTCWNYGDGGGKLSCETMTVQPLIWACSSCWTLIGLLVPAHLSWTGHIYLPFISLSSNAPRVTFTVSLHRRTYSAVTSCFHSVSFGTTRQRNLGQKDSAAAIVVTLCYVRQFEIHRKECLSCDSGPLEHDRLQACQVWSVTHDGAGDRQKHEHGCHRCRMFAPQLQTCWGCWFLTSLLTNWPWADMSAAWGGKANEPLSCCVKNSC